jgi:formylglycine-generating enzyme
MKHIFTTILLLVICLAACTTVDLNAPLPDFDTGIDPDEWAQIPAGDFFSGQFEGIVSTSSYEIMITDVTTDQYAKFLNEASASGYVELSDDQILGFYPGDEFNGVKHEMPINAGNWIFIPLDDPSQRIRFDGASFSVQPGFEKHPMTMVSWFGAWGFCNYYNWRLPTEMEWEKAGRGTDKRPFPWGEEILRTNANYYASRDPYEDMSTFGSRTTPVGFYNGKTYSDYATINSASPFGLYDMAGNVWQWTGNVYEGMHYRFLRGGSKDTYEMDLRLWVRNNATPTYFSPGVGFRCAR